MAHSLNYRPDIDGLRAVAVISVVFYHAFPGVLNGGFVGVDIFFVISGFLITGIITGALDRSEFSIVGFYQRRILRIFPALIFVLSACLIAGWTALLPSEYAQLGKHVAGGAGFVSNVVLQSEAGYFDTAGNLKPLLHLWSLGIEEQFYIAFPLLIWFAWNRGWSLAGVVGVGIVMSFGLNLALIGSDPAGTFYGPLTRAWELLVGSGLALAVRSRTALGLSTPQSSVVAFIGFALIVAAILLVTAAGFPGWQAMLPVLGAALLILAGPNAWLNRTVLSLKPMVWLGLISFPLYLWHWPLLVFARIMENGPVALHLRVAAVVLSILLSWATYRLVESPLRFAMGAKGGKTLFLMALMLMTGLSGMALFWTGGVESRLTGPTRAINQIISKPYPDMDYAPCSASLPQLDASLFDDCLIYGDGPPTVMFVGDSHTKQFRSIAWQNYFPDGVLMVTKSECLPFANAEFTVIGNCRDAMTNLGEFIRGSQSPSTVVIASHWAYLMSGSFAQTGSNWRLTAPPDDEDVESFSNEFETFAAAATRSGKQVVFVRDIPDLDFDIDTCFDNRPLRITAARLRADCLIDKSDFEIRMAPFDRVIDGLLRRHPELHVYNGRMALCDHAVCRAADSGLPLYTDGDHLNYLGAQRVMHDLVDKLGPELGF